MKNIYSQVFEMVEKEATKNGSSGLWNTLHVYLYNPWRK